MQRYGSSKTKRQFPHHYSCYYCVEMKPRETMYLLSNWEIARFIDDYMMTMTIQRMKTRSLYILAELDIIKKRYYYKIKAEVTLMRSRPRY